MIIRRRIVGAGLLAAVIGVSQLALAATTGTLSGTACKSVYDNAWGYGADIYYGVGVSSTDTEYGKFYACPIQRVNGLSSTGLSGAWIDLYESNTTGQSFCHISAYDEFGNQIATSGTKYSGGTGQREISFGGLSTSDPWGFYEVFCGMASRAPSGQSPTIYAYEWTER
jgi:hypothetical protein